MLNNISKALKTFSMALVEGRQRRANYEIAKHIARLEYRTEDHTFVLEQLNKGKTLSQIGDARNVG
jgi:hypothetical protein